MRGTRLFPVVGAVAAVLASVRRRSTNVLFELGSIASTGETATQITVADRFVTFVAVYDLLVGFASLVALVCTRTSTT
ncbi:hypothetical protein [Natronobacterium gregoryi]|uniref:Uncharacterized protein n=2 Tax=Natronobacterium gregoryi TaxID=44930 RepID=L0AH42_NATGS|nr:hypothetical protein [Natronobacterium gregoryi]AFZ73101.1 hypothetical protein Natgr_1917 [Natronobacterium gregoryi SP2]ELY70800.1 hypothetical protein C490_05902 [Natronobacterium gregoryi SP2]PLK20447.1 hypothetical protein CYV19_09625 [Natronobacterium gregoryi SP2]SFI61154.1 hypothetical protein SAMN05443661_102164 [Natronobacterium gregoryi]